MEFIQRFSEIYFIYSKELFWPILLGFLMSGFLYEFIPSKIIEKHLGQKGLRPILTSSFIGALLPICCFGTLPIAITMREKGARLGPVLAFLVTTPATSVSALLACWKLFNFSFTVYIFFAVIIMGLVIGILGNLIPASVAKTDSVQDDCCQNEGLADEIRKGLSSKSKGALIYAFVTLPKEIGLELLLGVAVASFIIVFQPAQHVIKEYLGGVFGYVFGLIVGLSTYVCSTASVPMADALFKSGMLPGAAMVYLLVGPITSYGTIFAVRKKFGGAVLGLYLGSITLLSLVLGMAYNVLVTGKIF